MDHVDQIARLITKDPDYILNEELIVENFLTKLIQRGIISASGNLETLARRLGIGSRADLLKQVNQQIVAFDRRQKLQQVNPTKVEQIADSAFTAIINASSKVAKTALGTAKVAASTTSVLTDPEVLMAVVAFSCIMGIASAPFTGAPIIGALITSVITTLLAKLKDLLIS